MWPAGWVLSHSQWRNARAGPVQPAKRGGSRWALRQTVTCSVTPNGVSLTLGARAGKYKPWWKQIAVTVHGAQPATMTIADHPRAGSVLIAAK